MATIKLFLLNTHFSHVNKTFVSEFVLRTMFRFFTSFLISVYGFLLKISGFIFKYVYRSKGENEPSFKANHSHSDDEEGFSKNFGDFEDKLLAEKRNLELSESQKMVQTGENNAEKEGSVCANISKCQFTFANNVSGFIEEAKTMKFEMFMGSIEDDVCTNHCLDSEFSQKRGSFEANSQDNLEQIDEEEMQEKRDEVVCTEYENLSNKGIVSMEDESMEDPDFAYEIELSKVKQDSYVVGNEFELLKVGGTDNNTFLDGNENEEDCDIDDVITTSPISLQSLEHSDDEDINLESRMNSNDKEKVNLDKIDESHEVESGVGLDDGTFLHEHSARIDEDIGASETLEDCDIDDAIKSSLIRTEKLQHDDDEYIDLNHPMVRSKVCKIDESHKVEGEVDNSREGASNSELWDLDSDDEDECDILLEHQHLVQQMKMEIKNSRIKGLPTISEESESPKMVEDLKPLNFDHKFEYKDVMEEISKFYKSYKDRMRKLDILNYQTLHAISFLQLKDSEVFTSGKKKSALMLKSSWPMKGQRVYVDPTRKSIVEMHRDLELVYVGQLCLSWEILCWQYVKAKELLEYDTHGFHSYNRVVEEFQQFQVLVQRFMEDERFQGPRIQNYVKNRCTIQSLLQVPIIQDDCLKDKKERRDEADAISIESLIEIIRGSMVILWEFLRGDKDKSTKTISLKGVQGAKIDLQEPEDTELIMDIITNIQKKERRVKEIGRSQNCIVKKFQKNQECELNNAVLTSRVELRLVSRVLGLSRLTTDQLVWCKRKLDDVNFTSRRVHLEPSFSLFPC